MKYFLILILFSFMAYSPLASDVVSSHVGKINSANLGNDPEITFFKVSYKRHQNMSQEVTNNEFLEAQNLKVPVYKEQLFRTKSDSISLRIPNQLFIEENCFQKYPLEDVPYVLENKALDCLSKGDNLNYALYTITSLWAGNENYDFINELEDHIPGIVDDIVDIDTSLKLQKALDVLQDVGKTPL